MEQMSLVSNKKMDVSLSKADIEGFRNSSNKNYHCGTLEKAHTCISYHIQAFQRQDSKDEMADMAEACNHCIYNQECDYQWFDYISSAIPETRYRFTLAGDCQYRPEDTDR